MFVPIALLNTVIAHKQQMCCWFEPAKTNVVFKLMVNIHMTRGKLNKLIGFTYYFGISALEYRYRG